MRPYLLLSALLGLSGAVVSSHKCGEMQVPIDWSHPNGSQTTLALARVKTNSSSRIGSLLYNPGGPGQSAIQLCQVQAAGFAAFSTNLTDAFDIVCVDPRGVGQSSPVSCDPELWNQRISYFPQSEAEFKTMVAHNKAFGESCLNMTGDLLKHMDTISVVKDFEAVRLALDDGKLNFLGESYGSQIGYQYAELYPKHVRAMALDSILDHTESQTYAVVTETSTYESTLDLFFQWCQNNQTCALYGQDVAQIFDELLTQANFSPFPAPGCVNGSSAGQCFANVTGENIKFNVQAMLIFEDSINPLVASWAQLGAALNATLNGDATLLSSPLATSTNSSVWQAAAVFCLDGNQGTTTYAQNRYKQELGLALAPHTSMASQSYLAQTQCIGWPARTKNPFRPLNQERLKAAPPILLVNAVHDPETSYVWAQSIRAQMPTATLLTRNGAGHTSYLLGGEAAWAIDAYLVNGTMPLTNLVVES